MVSSIISFSYYNYHLTLFQFLGLSFSQDLITPLLTSSYIEVYRTTINALYDSDSGKNVNIKLSIYMGTIKSIHIRVKFNNIQYIESGPISLNGNFSFNMPIPSNGVSISVDLATSGLYQEGLCLFQIR
jgi:hypothetical protein